MRTGKKQVYEFAVLEGYETVVLDEDLDLVGEKFYAASGVMQGESWVPIGVELLGGGPGGERGERADMPVMLGGGMLVFRSGAVASFRSAISPFGEELALSCKDADLVALNVTTKIDALDEEASRVSRFDDGRVMWVKDHVFRPGAVPDFAVFHIPQSPHRLLCTAGVAELFDQVKPSGTKLTLLWESS